MHDRTQMPAGRDASVAPASPAQGSAMLDNSAAQERLKSRLGGGNWTVRAGDSLWRIAAAKYGNGALWEEIQAANAAQIPPGTDRIEVGEVLEVPELEVDAATGKATRVEPRSVTRTTDFGVFEVFADGYEGPLPATEAGVESVRMSRFLEIQQACENDPIDEDVADLEEGVTFPEPVTVTIRGEHVKVSSKAEAQHAARIIKEIREEYGITVDSEAGVAAVDGHYPEVPETERAKLKTTEWEYKELVAVHDALAHFASILGTERDDSPFTGTDQEVSTVSKVAQSISKNKPDGKADDSTLGEYFEEKKDFSMFSAGTNGHSDFPTNAQQLEGTAVHEIAHGLMKSHLEEYRQATGYWDKAGSPVPDYENEEAPITAYGGQSPNEDLSEAMMFYFLDPDTLAAQCPKRYEFIDRTVRSWQTCAPDET